MGVDNGSNGAVSELCGDQFVTGTSCCFGGQWVDNDPTFCSLYKGDVRNVITTHLPHAIGNFKKSVMRIELGMTPQTGVHSFWRRATGAGRGAFRMFSGLEIVKGSNEAQLFGISGATTHFSA